VGDPEIHGPCLGKVRDQSGFAVAISMAFNSKLRRALRFLSLCLVRRKNVAEKNDVVVFVN